MDSTTQAWLELQCQFIATAKRAVVLLGSPEKASYEPMAHWPTNRSVDAGLVQLCEQCLANQSCLPFTRPTVTKDTVIVTPVDVAGRRFGVIAVLVATNDPIRVAEIEKLLQWGVEWFSWLAKERQTYRAQDDRLVALIELFVLLLKNDQLREASQQLVDWLQHRFSAKRVSVGLSDLDVLSIKAISGVDQVQERLPETNLTLAAMCESQQQGCSIVFPTLTEGTQAQFHQQLSVETNSGAVVSIPLLNKNKVVGVICLTGVGDFTDVDLRFCEQVALLLGPLIALKQRPLAREPVLKKINQSSWLKKIIAVSIAGLVLLSCIVEGTHKITAKAVINSEKKQFITVLQDGFIADAFVMPGDHVVAGQLLAVLEDGDLQLELQKWQSKKKQYMKSYNVALSKQDRGGVNVYRAQLDQADAQTLLIREQLKRLRLIAPFDGIVVKGDLKQSLGSPVKLGDTLYEVAKQGQYRLMLDIGEQDIRYVKRGLQGELLLTSLPADTQPFILDAITPIAAVKEGSSYFQAEAKLPSTAEGMRPGMTGLATIAVDDKPLIWLWTHRLFEAVYRWYWAL